MAMKDYTTLPRALVHSFSGGSYSSLEMQSKYSKLRRQGYGAKVNQLVKQTIIREFGSQWVPQTSGFNQIKLCKWLCKLFCHLNPPLNILYSDDLYLNDPRVPSNFPLDRHICLKLSHNSIKKFIHSYMISNILFQTKLLDW